jgi:hypothetical protein
MDKSEQDGQVVQPDSLHQYVDDSDPQAVVSYLHGVGAELQGLNPDNAEAAVRYASELLAGAHIHALRCRQLMQSRGPQLFRR